MITTERVTIYSPDGLEKMEVHLGSRVRGMNEDPQKLVNAIREDLGLSVAPLWLDHPGHAEMIVLGDLKKCSTDRWVDAGADVNTFGRAPWEIPGALVAVLDQVCNALKIGLSQALRTVQFRRHSRISSVFRIESRDGGVWVKCQRRVWSLEPRVIRILSKAVPHPLPNILAEGDGWWACSEFPEETQLRPQGDPLETLGEIQIQSMDCTAELIASGCRCVALSDIAGELYALGSSERLQNAAAISALDGFLPELERLSTDPLMARVPSTVIHGDVNGTNEVLTSRGWLLYDWTDAAITNPFLDLALPRRNTPPRVFVRREERFIGVWEQFLSTNVLHRAVMLSRVFGPAYQILNYVRIVESFGRPSRQDEAAAIDNWVFETARAVRAIQ